jgi:hypothetical protein
MKTLRDYRVAGALYVNDTGIEAQVSDQVTLFLDTDAEPDFPVSIVATIQHPITKVECGSVTSYVLEYDEADLDGAAALLRSQDIIDSTVISGVTVVADELDDEIAARIDAVLAEQVRATAAETYTNNALAAEVIRATAAEALKAPLSSPTFNGTVTLADETNVVVNATTGTKFGTATSQKLSFHNSTPVAQRAGAAQIAVPVTALTVGAGYVQAEVTAIITRLALVETLINELRAAVVEKGLIKGSA